MNGIARVIGSVVLLGACAAAMRFTMQKTEVPEMKYQLHTARLDTSNAKKIELDLDLQDAAQFHLKPSVAGRIAATFQGRGVSEVRLYDNTKLNPKKGVTRVAYQAANRFLRSYLGLSPNVYGTAELRLPRDVPLSLNLMGARDKPTQNVNLDFTGLNIKNFDVVPFWANFERLHIKLPKTIERSEFHVQNDTGYTRVQFNGSLKGRLVLRSMTGLIDVHLSELGINKNVTLMIWGDANNGEALRQRINSSNSGMVWVDPKRTPEPRGAVDWYVTGSSPTNNRDALYIEIQLGEAARVNIR